MARLSQLKATATALITFGLALPAAGQTVTMEQLEQMQRVIEAQQQQMEAMQAQIEQLKQSVASGAAATGAPAPVPVAGATSGTQPPQSTAVAAAPAADDTPKVARTNPRISLSISGQVNAAMNVVDDGEDTNFLFVDNDTSNSRVRFVGTGDFDGGTSLGTTVEVAVSPNNSSDVSQDKQNSNDLIQVRKAEAFARNDDYGRLMLGRGQAAADDTAEYDLSLTAGPIQYSGISDIVGGVKLRDDQGNLTGTTLADAFFNFDGNRQNRVRYDTPTLGPAQIVASAGSNRRWDVALNLGYDYGDWTGFEVGPFVALAGASLRDSQDSGVDRQFTGSASLLHEDTGVSVTLSGGGQNKSASRDPFNTYAKLAWDTDLVSIGTTGFGVDYTYSRHNTGDGDIGQSVGVAAVQTISEYGIEVYGQVRGFDVKGKQGRSFQNVVSGTVGTRAKF